MTTGKIRTIIDKDQVLTAIAIFTTIIQGLAAFGFASIAFQYSPSDPSFRSFGTLTLASLLCAMASGSSISKNIINNSTLRFIAMAFSVQGILLTISAFVPGIGTQAAVISLTYTFVTLFISVPPQKTQWPLVIGVLDSMLIALVNVLSPFSKTSISLLSVYLTAIMGSLIMVYIVFLLAGLIETSLQVKIVTAAIVASLVPLTLITFLQTTFSKTSLQYENFRGLQAIASQSALKIDNFIKYGKLDSSSIASHPVVIGYLSLPPNQRNGSELEMGVSTLANTLTKLGQYRQYVYSFGLVDANGTNVFDTNPALLAQSEADTTYFRTAHFLSQTNLTPVLFDSQGNPLITFSTPVFNSEHQLIGLFRVHYKAAILQAMLAEMAGFTGTSSRGLLLDEYMLRLADPLEPAKVFSSIAPLSTETAENLIKTGRLPKGKPPVANPIPEMVEAIKNSAISPTFTFSYRQSAEEPIIGEYAGVITPLTTTPWYLIYIQRQDMLFDTINRQNNLMLIIAICIAGLFAVSATMASRFISNPILDLTASAKKISAGDIETVASIQSNDEFGSLAEAFNMMTQQLRSFIHELENRVRDRTEELARQNASLQYRTRQLQTISEVARGIASTQDLETLLNQVTRLISQRFGFYHVGVFLLDEQREYAVLRASNSEGGKRMLSRQHKLKIGQTGIVGYVTAKGEPRITSDTGADAVYYDNPDLPLTRSEMAIPLRIGQEIIGALDVQSTESNAFSEEDVELFGILADQVAIAIANNRLFDETNRALEEMQRLHRQYLRQEWTREVSTRKYNSYIFTPQGIAAHDSSLLPEAQRAIETGQPLVQSANDNPSVFGKAAIMAVPIVLRGEPIGAIQLQERVPAEKEWNEEELTAVKAVADQIALALENARLFEQTVRRAERERKVLEITSKIRSTTNLNNMLEIAVSELQKALKASRIQVILQRPEVTGNASPQTKERQDPASNSTTLPTDSQA